MVNRVILVGNVGADPEVRTVGDTKVANFNLATSERGFKTKDGKEVPERTEWHRIVVWRGLASVVESYVKKGSQLYIEGKIRTRDYEDKDGNKRYTTEIVVDVLNMLGGKSDSQPQRQETPLERVAKIGEPVPPSDDLPF